MSNAKQPFSRDNKNANPINDLKRVAKRLEVPYVYRKPLIGRHLLERACDELKKDMKQGGKSEDEIHQVIERVKGDFDIVEV